MLNDPIFNNSKVLVNPVNCQKTMGSGLARKFKKAFPKNYEKFKSFDLDIGTLLITEEKDKIIVNFPNVKEYDEPSKYGFIFLGMKALLKFYYDHEDKYDSIMIPNLGSFVGLDWLLTSSIIFEHAFRFETKWTVNYLEPLDVLRNYNIDLESHLLLDMDKKLKNIPVNYQIL